MRAKAKRKEEKRPEEEIPKGRPRSPMSSRSITEDSKDGQLDPFREEGNGAVLTTDQAVPVSDTNNSLKAGTRGPTLMEDFHFREKLTHFDHEPIPERVVHARGSGAHGYFEVYRSMGEYTKAKFLQDPGKRTPVFVRFSQVVGSRGSADTVRDARGFATKFYTEDGNYDLVGNNIPVFFIQDAIKFPDLVHAIKPEQDNEMPQASAAHDTFWDFISLMPESAHMIMWLLSDRGIQRSYRMMEGFGVNTFRFVNKEGISRFVKFHWKPKLGTHGLVWDEAQKLSGKDPDFLRRDLWEAIEAGDYPEYELGVQMIDEEDEFDFDFDILDPTKIWPEEDVPVMLIGRMVLNRNPDNFHSETEQVAFHPGNVVPGIDFSNDPLLQGRLFSYLDTQLIRLGGPNFTEIPINRPLAPVHNNHRGAYHRHTINKGKVSCYPNSLGAGYPVPDPEEGYVHYEEKVEGRKVRMRSDSFGDHFSQATLFWNSMTEPEKEHIVEAFHFEIGKVGRLEIRQRMVDMINNVDGELAVKVAEGVGAEPPANPMPRSHERRSPALSMEDTVKDTVRSLRVAVLAADGLDHKGLSTVREELEKQGAHVQVISKNLGSLNVSTGAEVKVDKNFVGASSIMYDAVLVPGGRESVSTLQEQGDAIHFINEAFRHCKPIGAIVEGVELLMAADMKGIGSLGKGAGNGTSSKKGVVIAGKRADLYEFSSKFAQAIAQHRHWDREGKESVPA